MKRDEHLTIMVMNQCLRVSDSQMLNYYKLNKSDNKIAVLIANSENSHKNEFDL